MKKKLLFFLLIMPLVIFAQPEPVRTLEAGFLFGFNNYSGDIAQKRIELRESRFGYGAFCRYQISSHFAVRAHVYTGNITGDDKNNPSLAFRKFKFSANIFEIAAVGEWHFLGKKRLTETGPLSFLFSPYVFGGVGTTRAEPTVECYAERSVCAQYTVIAFPEPDPQYRYLVTPAGFGLKVDVADRINLGGEIGWRPTYSDSIDGIKVNGNPKKGDWYYFVGLSLSYILNDPNKFRRG